MKEEINTDGGEYGAIFGLILGVLFVGGLIFFFAGNWDKPAMRAEAEARIAAKAAMWRDAIIVRICRDGTRIFQLTDGSYRTGELLVKGPEVCE